MIYFLLRVFSSLPLAVMQILGATIGLITYLSSARYRGLLNHNLSVAAKKYGFTPAQWSSAMAAGMTFADTLWIWQHPKKSLEISHLDNSEEITSLIEGRQGMIVLAPHLGGFEIIPRVFSQKINATVMYKPARISWLNSLMIKCRKHPNMHFVPASLDGVRKIKRALKNGEVVGILADQVPSVGDGVWAKFFNQFAYTSTFPIKLTRLNKVSTIFVSAERRGLGKGWTIKSKLMKQPFPDDSVEAATVMNEFFEEMIMLQPSQYMWSYNRYKRPTGAELAPME